MHVDRKIFTTRFACDLAACKAACCTFPGGSGPPVLVSEVPILEQAYDLLKDRLPVQHQRLVASRGLLVEDDGELTIRCYDERACVFVVFEGDIARCAIQQAYDKKEFSWPKPLSCHLFPIRVSGKNRDRLRFERFTQCDPGLELGEQLDVPLVDFLKEPLIRGFGDDVFALLKDHSDELREEGA